MVNPNRFYTYAYLREDRTPYYIGKGSGKRIYDKKGRPCNKPKDKSRIVFLKQNLTEEEAFRHEIYMIDVLGRKDLGTGILHNKTDGGDGASGAIKSEELKKKLSELMGGDKNHNYGKKWWNDKCGNEVFSIKCPPNWYSGRNEETIQKGTETRKGRKWWNDGNGNSKFVKECPGEGWVLGRSEESKRNMSISTKHPPKKTRENLSKAKKGVKWWNDGCGNNKFSKECPGLNWFPGMSEETKIRKSKALKGKTKSEEHRRNTSEGMKIRNRGRKWWNDGNGNSKFVKECPGENWVSGRGQLKNWHKGT
jgi:hypothetical protein